MTMFKLRANLRNLVKCVNLCSLSSDINVFALEHTNAFSTCRKSCLTSSGQFKFSVARRNFFTSPLLGSKDYYKILGVPRSATQKEIKKAYYDLAKKNHPDINKGDPQAAKKFQEVAEAYDILSDETKRQQFDQWGTTGDFAGTGSTGGFQGFSSTINPEELFRNIFNDFGFSTGFTNSNFSESQFGYGSQEITMNLKFKEAACGVNKDISVNISDTCPNCKGSRCQPGTSPVRCPACNGSGMETISTGPFVMKTTCRKCHGSSVHIKHPCSECGGKGTTVQRKIVTVPVPAGVADGQTVRMEIAKKKELFITFRVAKSDYFRRDGADIHTDAVISLSQAILGGSVDVRGIYENMSVKIFPGTSSHIRVRLEGKGIKRLNTYGYGDHYVHIKIKAPSQLTPKQKALMLAYAELEEESAGNINGVVETKQGKSVVTDDKLLQQIRSVLHGTESDEEDESGRKAENNDRKINTS